MQFTDVSSIFITSFLRAGPTQAAGTGTAKAASGDESENITRWIVDQQFRREQEKLRIPYGTSSCFNKHASLSYQRFFSFFSRVR